ncbi:MAG: DUF1552 domain-containing protein [Myxococcota bacterium]
MSSTRRWLLKGAGAALAIPVLPSLLRGRAAEAAAAGVKKNFVFIGTHHGGAWPENMLPIMPAPSTESMSYAGRVIRRAPLAASDGPGGTRTLSPILVGAPGTLPDSLVSKMFVLRGLDVPFYLAHHDGGYLGNFATGGNDTANASAARPTIDQIMAWSPSFYSDLGGVTQRSVVFGVPCSFDHSSPAARTGPIQALGPTGISLTNLFDALFPAAHPTARAPIVDRVLDSYRALRNGPRISQADKLRLDDHLERIAELQRRLGTVVACTYPPPPVSPYSRASYATALGGPGFVQHHEAQEAWFDVLTDLLVAAFSCGLTRVAAGVVGINFVDAVPNSEWHQGVAHRAREPDGVQQGVLASAYRSFFQAVLLKFAQKMEAVTTADGKTLLDQSLVVWSQECGIITHHSRDCAVVGFGGAGGALRTGQICDYRNLDLAFDRQETHLLLHPGLLWHQWLGTALQAMGIPKSEYEQPATNPGYPDFKYMDRPGSFDITPEAAYPEIVWSSAGEILPYLGA